MQKFESVFYSGLKFCLLLLCNHCHFCPSDRRQFVQVLFLGRTIFLPCALLFPSVKTHSLSESDGSYVGMIRVQRGAKTRGKSLGEDE